MSYRRTFSRISWQFSKSIWTRRCWAIALVVLGAPVAVLAAIAGGIGILWVELVAIKDMALDLWSHRRHPDVYTSLATDDFESSAALWEGAPTFPDTKPPAVTPPTRKSLTTEEQDQANV